MAGQKMSILNYWIISRYYLWINIGFIPWNEAYLAEGKRRLKSILRDTKGINSHMVLKSALDLLLSPILWILEMLFLAC